MMKRKYKALSFLIIMFVVYFFGLTGPRRLESYPQANSSPYRLPWKSGDVRFVSQGNRSFTTHRGRIEHAWDFWMAVGTPVFAARGGVVKEVVDHLDGVGIFHGNFIAIEHKDGTRAIYAHLKKQTAQVKIGETIQQGKVIGQSGMVGFTINPHLHFHVLGPDGLNSIPITFREVKGGIPLAGRFYKSENLQ